MLKTIISYYLVLGMEEEDMYYNSFTGFNKKPNLIYRIYKRFSKEFRKEANAYISRYDYHKPVGMTVKWGK